MSLTCLCPCPSCTSTQMPCHIPKARQPAVILLQASHGLFTALRTRSAPAYSLSPCPEPPARDRSCTASLALCTVSQAQSRSSSRPPPSYRRLSENSLVKGLPAVCTKSPKACLTGRGLGRTGVKALGWGIVYREFLKSLGEGASPFSSSEAGGECSVAAAP